MGRFFIIMFDMDVCDGLFVFVYIGGSVVIVVEGKLYL